MFVCEFISKSCGNFSFPDKLPAGLTFSVLSLLCEESSMLLVPEPCFSSVFEGYVMFVCELISKSCGYLSFSDKLPAGCLPCRHYWMKKASHMKAV